MKTCPKNVNLWTRFCDVGQMAHVIKQCQRMLIWNIQRVPLWTRFHNIQPYRK